MATELLFSELKAWLDAQPENTVDTPYEIIIKNAPSGEGKRYAMAITRFVRIVGMEMNTGVTSIGQEAFLMCTNLVHITVPGGVTSIGAQAFQGCSNLKYAQLPLSLTTIDSQAFTGCSGLTGIGIAYGITSIGHSAFRNCSSLNAIELPMTLTSIGDYAFGSCKSLTIAYVYAPFSETLMQSNSFFNTPSTLRLLVYPPILSGWQPVTLTNYGFASGARVESLYTRWVRVA